MAKHLAWGISEVGETVNTEFEDFNAYVYHASRGLMLDAVIWCLGPYVDDTRPYGSLRILLARQTRCVVRRWYHIVDEN